MGLTKELFDSYVNKSVQSGLPQLVLKLIPVVDIEKGEPIAFRSKTVINSIIWGSLQEIDYVELSDVVDCGIDLFYRNIIHVIDVYNKLTKKGYELDFITVRCPVTFPERISLYDKVKEALSLNPKFPSNKLCIEFSKEILLRDTEKVITAIADLKLLKVKTAITGCGETSFLAHKLVDVTPTYVFIDNSATKYAGSRNKPKLIPSMIQFVESMGIEAFCEGEKDYRKLLRSTTCKGFIDIDDKGMELADIKERVVDSYGEA